jgi:molecular chaperone HscB
MNTNVIGLSSAKDSLGTDIVCWFCQKQLSPRALFCNHCGTIQPVRALDHFTRLGLERRIDIDQTALDRQYGMMQKTFDPDRFAIRTPTERTHAAKQLEALTEAHSVLRDPVRRGRYWLALHNHDFTEAQAAVPLVQEMRLACQQAETAPAIDRVAQQASMAFEEGIMRLMQCLRQQNWQHANLTLLELDGMEIILDEARGKRQTLNEKS